MPIELLLVGMVEVVEEGRFVEVTPVGFIVSEVISHPRVIIDGCRHAVRPEGKGIGAEDGDHDAGARGGDPVGPPRCGSVVATVACGDNWGNTGTHGSDLRNHRCKLKISHVAVTPEVCGYDQAPRNVGGEAQVPKARALASGP